MIISGNHVYVTNTNNTVSVIDMTTKQVTATIPVSGYPTRVAATADGHFAYVGHYDTVSVIDTTTNQVTATIQIPAFDAEYFASSGGLTDVAVSPDGSLVYAARTYYTDTYPFSAVSVIDTATNTVGFTKTTAILNDMEVTPGGTRIYGAEGDYRSIPVFDAVSMTPAGGVEVRAPGGWPYVSKLAISPDGKRGYAVVAPDAIAGGDAVTVVALDTDPTSATYNQQIATITIPGGAQDVAVSPDGRAYVTNLDGKTVTVIDTATNTVIGSFITDQGSNGGTRDIAVGPDGTIYITDASDGMLYVVTVANLAQQA